MGDWTSGECGVRNLAPPNLQASLGYSLAVLPKSHSRNSDVDFSDVFGGPPRRSSTQEFSHSERDSIGSHSLDDNDNSVDEESSWIKFREKPVFGETTGLQRRYTSDDFFDDIFRGDQPSSSSQSPRVGARRSPFASAPGSRLMSPSRSLPTELFAIPAKFSLPSRLTNTDFTASTSSSQSSFNPPLSRFNQTIPNHDVGDHSSPRSSALPRQNSTNVKESTSDSQLGGIADQSHINSNVKVSELPVYATNFHFSIYKWASKGVPVVISLRKKSPRSNEATKLDKVHEDLPSYGLEDSVETQSPDFVVHERNDPPKSLPKKTKFNMKPLSSLLKEDAEVIIGKGRVEEKEKLSSVKNVLSPKVDKTATANDGRKSEATGKVKDFVRIFNKESPSKPPGPRLRQSESRRWNDTKTIEVDYEIRFSSARMSEETEATYVNWGEEMEDGDLSGSQQFNINDIGFAPDTTDAQTTANAPNVDIPRDSASNTNEASDDDVMTKEAIKGCETKVSLWAKGKEGNIRALLSTLQYVLWPDSGWKPVPLVDIIEANAVKRAYQKALLRLHPDKLQQKGATSHHKLIAEKVFDILQEAWDQFNSLGSL